MTRRHAHAAAGRRAHRAVAATLARDVVGAVEGHGAVGAVADAPTKNADAAGRSAAPAPGPAASTPSPVTTLVAPLAGADTLLFRRLSGTEEISRLHAWEVEVVSRNPSLDPQALLGRHATVVVRLDDGGGPGAHGDETATEASKRYLDGIVTRFGMREGPAEDGRDRGGASGPPLFPYRLILRPWLWLATQQGASGVKVWEGLAVPALLAQVLAPYGHRWSLDRLTRAYRPRPRTVQYRETDFDFIARLCEDEGIHWFFEHEAGAHCLVFVDGGGPGGAYLPVPGGAAVPFLGPSSHGGSSGARRPQHVDYWTMGHEPELATWCPGAGVPGEASGMPRGRTRANAHSNKRGLAPGHTLVLRGHPRADQNQAYLVVAVDYHLEEGAGPHPVGSSPQAVVSSVQRFAMEAHPLASPFQQDRQAVRPRVQGLQVGVVVSVVEAAGGSGLRATVRLPAVGEGVQGGGGREGDGVGAAWSAAEEAGGWLAVLPVVGGGGGREPLRSGDDVLVDFIGGDPEQPVCLGRLPIRSG